MALEMILAGDEPKDLKNLDITLDDKAEPETPETPDEPEPTNEQVVELDDDAINATLDELLGTDEDTEDETPEPAPAAKAKPDTGTVPRGTLIAERKKYQAQIDALKAENAKSKTADVKKLLADSGYGELADPVEQLVMEKIRPLLEQQRDLQFALFAKDNPDAAAYKDQVMQFATTKDLDYESAWLVLRGKAATRKTSSDMDMEASARADQKLREKADANVDVRPTAAIPVKPKNAPKLSQAQIQLAQKAGMNPNMYLRHQNVSWDDGNKLARERKTHT